MPSYKRLPVADGNDSLADEHHLETGRGRQILPNNHGRLLILLVMLISNTASFIIGRKWPVSPLDHLQALTTWSPLHASLPYTPHTTHLNATTWTSNPSLWRSPPNATVDALWKSNWDSRPVLVPATSLPKLNLEADASYAAPWLDDPSYAMVGSQAHHLLHCLDVLRKAVWSDHYWPHGNLNPGHRTHQTHCVDLLRQDIQCRAPRDVYPLIWMEGESQPTPNFNVSMQCGDWDGMWRWWRARQMTEEQVARVWVKPEGLKQWPAPGGLREEKAALREVCARKDVTCTIDGKTVHVD